MARGEDASCIADVKAVLGEGPVWVESEQALYWTDIPERRLHRWTEAAGATPFDLPVNICSLAPRAGGGFIGASYRNFIALALDPLQLDLLANPEPDIAGNRFNDGKVDRQGRFWAGTMDRREREASGSLYRLDRDLEWTRIDSSYRVTNGPAFSLDGRKMYHNDSALGLVYVFDLAADGSAANRRPFARFEADQGYPDGMTVDSEDCLWVALWDGWCIQRLSPSGERLERLQLPVQRPTSCAFGGPDLDRLFITSARRGLDLAALAMQPYAGGLFMTLPDVKGVAEPLFAG